MEKAGIVVLESEKKEETKRVPKTKVTLKPNARVTLSPNARGVAKKISPNAAAGSKFPAKKGPSPNKGLAAKKPLIKNSIKK